MIKKSDQIMEGFYVIYNMDNDKLFWNVITEKWVDTSQETRFTEQQRQEYFLPERGSWAWCIAGIQ